MAYKRTPYVAFNDQRKSARKRGIGWQFTFDGWVKWWEAQLGPDWFKMRGHFYGQYVMARNGDEGPYAPSNVRAAKVEDNHGEFNRNKPGGNRKKRRHLSPQTVAAIYQAEGLYADLAKRFKLDVHSIHRIKCRKCYANITEGLEKGGSG